tara:strand:+ start:35278 stop:38427 length:3150 start_codon:yes stop_codon:yes gene_type:complete
MPIQAYSLKVSPENHFINWQQDPFSNYLARLVFPEKSRELSIDVEVIVDMTVVNPFDFFLEESVDHFPFKYDRQLKKDLAPYLQITEKGPLMIELLSQVDRSKQATINFLVALNQMVQQRVAYLIRMQPGVQTCEETLQFKSGSCRDSAWLLVQLFRHLGLAARFVSGYLVQLKSDQKALDGPSGPEEDFTDLHAWAEVYIPGAGWLGMDATSGLFAGEGHIPLACTPDPQSAAPISGSTEPCKVEFEYTNTVKRIHEDPRVTKPYSEDQWQAIDQLGRKVDVKLQEQKLNLTMGGEPTFVSIDDMEGAEWNSKALGKDKLRLASDLLMSLKEHFAGNGFIHHGQGKWYPGEELPRWALGIFWRTDNKPLWHDASLLDDSRTNAKSKGKLSKTSSQKFMTLLTEKLGLDKRFALPTYEDADFYLKREGQLPKNVSVADSKLSNKQDRQRLRKVFDQGLKHKVGYVLPLKWDGDEKKGSWASSRWEFSRSRVFLIPGDSAMGYRLPLDSLPWEIEREYDFEKDPFAERKSLEYPPGKAEAGKSKTAKVEKIIHTALCAEVREGKLYIFMPPLSELESYVRLLDVLEKCAAELQVPLILEGYEPPRDPRLKKLMITPDPGVIEVNIHPSASWQEAIDNMSILYEAARNCRLGTEKFMLDGKHTGTGGGNHVTLGAAKAEDSPFLIRPHLLESLLRYWQNHPSLSYLFSGQFIGPTSQAPRVDEARDDNLYELEIALQQLPQGETDRPWLIDRILRNFLVDLTGNTHRSEFCIDKLYSPSSATGRLGLVEFRNFEMPPHWRMSAVQILLLRSLLARFAIKPYKESMIHWDHQLHDRFMLPHYISDDMRWVVKDLNDAGFEFDIDWLSPFQEFRFPHYGSFHVAGLQLDIHGAIEPWHVLGEESSTTGTSRYVDSSVERLQLKIQGLYGERLMLCCNKRRIPLQPTGKDGEFVAGVRFKAWDPYSAIHPTIGVHSPLVFDVVDTLNGRSLGGCTYYVAHPGGRNYDTFPINANEAEARRVARITTKGHSQGKIKVIKSDPHPKRPYTLDLRYQ